jgi:hypothetical protein
LVDGHGFVEAHGGGFDGGFGVFLVAREEEVAGFFDGVGGGGVGGIVGGAGPDGVFVELNAFVVYAAENGAAEAAVAKGKGFEPFACGAVVPESEGAGGTGGFAADVGGDLEGALA